MLRRWNRAPQAGYYISARLTRLGLASTLIDHQMRPVSQFVRLKAVADNRALMMEMKLSFILVFLFTALLISCKQPSQPAVTASSNSNRSWTDFRSQEGNFAAQFPQPPEDKLLDEEKDVVTTRSAKAAISEGVIYDVIYASFAKEQPINEADFETFKKAIYKGLGKCTTGAQGPASPVLEGYRGRQYKTHCTTDDGTELTEVINIYLGKRHAYSMTVLWRSDDPEPQDEKTFLASIRLLDPAK